MCRPVPLKPLLPELVTCRPVLFKPLLPELVIYRLVSLKPLQPCWCLVPTHSPQGQRHAQRSLGIAQAPTRSGSDGQTGSWYQDKAVQPRDARHQLRHVPITCPNLTLTTTVTFKDMGKDWVMGA